MKTRPEVIAYSKDLAVIPFENVIAVAENPKITGGLRVGLSGGSGDAVCIDPKHAQEFIDKYNLYLAAVEGLTIESKLVPAFEGKQHDDL